MFCLYGTLRGFITSRFAHLFHIRLNDATARNVSLPTYTAAGIRTNFGTIHLLLGSFKDSLQTELQRSAVADWRVIWLEVLGSTSASAAASPGITLRLLIVRPWSRKGTQSWCFYRKHGTKRGNLISKSFLIPILCTYTKFTQRWQG